MMLRPLKQQRLRKSNKMESKLKRLQESPKNQRRRQEKDQLKLRRKLLKRQHLLVECQTPHSMIMSNANTPISHQGKLRTLALIWKLIAQMESKMNNNPFINLHQRRRKKLKLNQRLRHS